MSQDDTQTRRFTIDEEQTRQYRLFNAQGTQLTVRLLLPSKGEDSNPMSHFLASVTELFEYALRDHEDNNMIGVTISNEVKEGKSYRDQLQTKEPDNRRCDLVGLREGRPVEC